MQPRDRREPVLVHVEAKDLVFAPRPRSRQEMVSRAHERTRAANAFAWRIGLAVGAGVLVALLLFNVFERRQAARDVAAITAAMETELAKGQVALERQLAALSAPEGAAVRAPARGAPVTHPCVAEPWRCQAPAARAARTASTCVKRGEPTLFTTGACPDGWRAAREVAYVPEPVTPQRPIARPQPRSPVSFVMSADTGSNHARAQSRCEAAKAHREAQLRIWGLRRTYELLQQLDAQVHEACK